MRASEPPQKLHFGAHQMFPEDYMAFWNFVKTDSNRGTITCFCCGRETISYIRNSILANVCLWRCPEARDITFWTDKTLIVE